MRSKSNYMFRSDSDEVRQLSSKKIISITDRRGLLPGVMLTQQETSPNKPKLQWCDAEKSFLTSITSSFLLGGEEKAAFAKCPHNPIARRIFTFHTVSLLLIFQSSQSRCLSLSVSSTHPVSFLLQLPMCKRLFNDSVQCLNSSLGVTKAHTLAGRSRFPWGYLIAK